MGQATLILPGVQGVPPAWPGLAPSTDFSEVDAWGALEVCVREGVCVCVAGCCQCVYFEKPR